MKSASEKKFLEGYSSEYLQPDKGRKVDNKVECLAVKNVVSWVKGPKILELGFGDGIWTEELIRNFGSSEIVDASKILLNDAKTKYGNKVKLYENLFEKFSPPYRYNSIIASYVLEHVINPVFILKKCKKWILHNGKIIILVPHAYSIHRRLGVEMGIIKRVDSLGEVDKSIGHRRIYTIPQMENHIKKAGLKIKKKRGLFIKVLPNKEMALLSDEILSGLVGLGAKLPMEYSCILLYQCGL